MPLLSELMDKFLRRATLDAGEKTSLRTDIGAISADEVVSDAADVTFTSGAGIAATDVAGALDEVATANTGDETTGTILDKLKGAVADATRIGTEYMPEVLEGVSIILADTETAPGPLILDDGAIALDASRNIVIHDGVTPGGNVYVPQPTNRLHGRTVNTSVPQLTTAVLLGTIPLTAAQMADGKFLRIYGRVDSLQVSQVNGLFIYFSFAANPNPLGAAIDINPVTNALSFFEFDITGEINNGAIAAMTGKKTSFIKAADTPGAMTIANGEVVIDTFTGVEAAAQNLEISIFADPAAAWGCNFNYDVTVEVY